MKKKIRIYSDNGVSLFSLKCLINELTSLKLDIDTISSNEVIEENWQDSTSIFVMPGGRDLMYLRKLKDNGCKKIKEFVEDGGSYLGICAGAYFGAEFVEFEKGNDLEVLGRRELNFVKAKAIGPAYKEPKFSYKNHEGSKAALVEYKPKDLKYLSSIYFKGGCYFEGDSQLDVIGKYSDLNKAAIVKSKVKKGKAILSGVHIECSSNDIDGIDDNLSLMKEEIKRTESIRKKIFIDILENLLI
ncbi:MAG: hypothetical protein KR126chlam4_00664 [Candidatus Anoxychlamydiales bacterium]|nr:hypothetical protein [Candidatus Anoxychlamydiales bacterium]HEU64596.1 biotin--protein ligase [Chlamydiota bacterium]